MDIKNPNTQTEEITYSTEETLIALKSSFETSKNIISELETLLK